MIIININQLLLTKIIYDETNKFIMAFLIIPIMSMLWMTSCDPMPLSHKLCKTIHKDILILIMDCLVR